MGVPVSPFRPLSIVAGPVAAAGISLALHGLAPSAAFAQRESYLVGPGSSVGPATKVKPTNCVTAPDGAISCDTELQNSPGDTKARPQYELFNN